MTLSIPRKMNLLGDVKAEDDKEMLNRAFYETQSFKSIQEEGDLPVIVGRRGSGKSALCYELSRVLPANRNSILLSINGNEGQTYGIYSLFDKYSGNYNLLQATMKIIWRYAFLTEICSKLKNNYKIKGKREESQLIDYCRNWDSERNICFNLRKNISSLFSSEKNLKEIIADLEINLNIYDLYKIINTVLVDHEIDATLLLDGFDEGYQSDNIGTAYASGIVYAAIEINSYRNIKAVCFIRDSIFKSIENKDDDFSRNVSRKYVRLHWEERELFNMVTNRLKITKELDKTTNAERIWNRCAKRELSGYDGFRSILRHTLYRPRDVLSLLNQAFFRAATHNRGEILLEDIESSALEISRHRRNDLIKEYQAIYGQLDYYTRIFSGDKTSYTIKDALVKINDSIKSLSAQSDTLKEIVLFDSSASILELLLRIGFLGIKSNASTKYTFTHDGSDSEKTFFDNDEIMVHPCFWRALEITDEFSRDMLEDIQDEYDVEIVSDELSIRKRDIGRHIASVGQIAHGMEDASKFEEWCKTALIKCFSNGLTNFELHPNKNETFRRDIVASYNNANNVWGRIHSDYSCRQVIFEIKNYKDITNADFRQFWSYLTTDGPYGKLMFYICRDDKNEPTSHEVTWMREGYNSQARKICVKLTDKFLCSILSKLRRPQRIDNPDLMMKKILDIYERQYLR